MRIKSISKYGRYIELEDKNKLLVSHYHRNDIMLWSRDEDIVITKRINLFWPYVIKNINTKKQVLARHMIISDLVPEHKSDIEAVERIKKANPSQIEPILPDLFEWTEDVNWPIAPRLAEVLARFGEIVIPYVIHYLRHPYGLDEYGVYYHLMPMLKKEHLVMLADELEMILKNPSDFQKSEEYDVFALKYLIKLNCYSWEI